MINIVDRNKDQVIQKVTKPNGRLVRYQLVPAKAGDATAVKVFATLSDARKAIGKTSGGKIAQ